MTDSIADRLKEEGNILMKENRPHDAIAKYTEAISVSGSSHLLLSNRSAAYAKAKMWKEALEDADSCVSLNEKFDKGYARKAGALMGMGNYKDALKVCKDGLGMCPESKVILAKKSEIEQGQARPTSPSISFPQRAFGFLAPLSFAYLMYVVVVSFSIGNISDLREILLILSAHMLVGLVYKYGIASFRTLKSMYQAVSKREYNASVVTLKQIQEEIWLHYFMFAITLSNATPLIPLFFILATVAIMSSHVLLFAVRERAPFAADWYKWIDRVVTNKIPYLEVAISLGLIADLFTPHRSLFATFMYFWVFQRQRLVRKSSYDKNDTREVWLKLHENLAPFMLKLPLLNKLYPKLAQMAAKFANPEGVAFKQ